MLSDTLTAVLVILAQSLLFATATFRALRYFSRPPEEAAALALALLPVTQCAGILVAVGFHWQLGNIMACTLAALGLALVMRPLELLRQRVVVVWVLVALCWLGQEAMVRCHGRAFWMFDWNDHFHIAAVITQAMQHGQWPVIPSRTPLLGIYAAPALTVSPTYPVFQVTSVLMNSLIVPAVWLWAVRLGGQRAALATVALVLLCAGITESVLYTWPKMLSAALVLVALYLWEIDWQLLAGIAFAAAFQAHQGAAAYTAAFFVCALRVGVRQYPWRTLGIYAVLSAAWLVVLRTRFPAQWQVNPYFKWDDLFNRQELYFFYSNLLFGVWPMGIWKRLYGPEPLNWWLRTTTDTLVVMFPVVGSVALLWRPRGASFSRRSACAAWSLFLGYVLAAATMHGFTGMGNTEAGQAPFVLALLVVAGVASLRLSRTVALPLWIATVLQFVAFRAPFAWLNFSDPDAYNLGIKNAAHLQFLLDLHPLAPAVGLAVAIASAIALGMLLVARATELSPPAAEEIPPVLRKTATA